LVTGTVLWQIFADSIQIPIRVITQSKQMLAKINFPREALMITAFGESLFNFAIRLVILIVAYLILGFTPAASVPMAFVGVLAMICLGLAIGLLLSPFALLYEDVANGLTLFIQIWMYATPVIYAPKSTGLMGWVNKLNPISPVLCQTRDWVLTGEWTFVVPASFVFGTTLIFIAVGFVVYRVALPRAIERLSS
jgi:lipopolysaccharide transport system permease protein